jgi:hypothetical protein
MKTLKTIFTIAVFIFSMAAITNVSAQKVYSCDSKYDADIKVYVTDSKYDADLWVYKVSSQYDVNDDGLWFFVDSKYDAKKKIWFADSKYDADLIIYFVDSQYDAKWNNTSKKYLIY